RRVKILVALKRVADPDNANKIKVAPNKIDTPGLEFKPNPIDEYAVETALRLTDNAANTKARLGGGIVVPFVVHDTEMTLRATLAAGVTVDLAMVSPIADQSKHTKAEHAYQAGVRFAALMAIMGAKKKPLVEVKVAALTPDAALTIQYTGFEPPAGRKAGVKV